LEFSPTVSARDTIPGMSVEPSDQLHFEGYVIDRSRWTLRWLDEPPIALSRKSFDVLLYLVDHRSRVVGKDELLSALWPGQIVEESNLTQHIFLLRKALARHASGAKIIETVAGRGYRFSAPLEVSGSVSPELIIGATESVTRVTVEEVEIEPDEPRPLLSGEKRRGRLAVLALLAGVLLGAAWFGWQLWQNHTGGSPVQVLLTPMQGSTGDIVLDRSLVDAMRIDFVQSPFVSVVSAATIRSTLAEMKQNPNETVNPDAAREVCERTNSQAVLHGTIARNGQHYLLTEEATSCVNGETLAAATAEAAKPEDLPHSIDAIAASLRRKLGESRRSIARFNAPLFPVNTASLEALKAYSEAERMADQGDFRHAITLMQQAIGADSEFATAYSSLGSYYASIGDFDNERSIMQKAYALRDSASAPTRFGIIARYNTITTGDLFEAERTYQSWTELYPNSGTAWNRLGIVQRDLGKHAQAAASGARALILRPKALGLYFNLSIDQLHAGDIQAARDTCDRAIAKGLDGEQIRNTYFKIAYLLGDAELLKVQREWFAIHPDAFYHTLAEATVAIAEGRLTDSHQLIGQAIDVMRRKDLGNLADTMTKIMGVAAIDAGDAEYGTALFRSVPVNPQVGSELLGLAESGDLVAARAGLAQMQKDHPRDTLWNLVWGPMVGAEIAVRDHRPADAAALYANDRLIDSRDLEMSTRRGNAFLAAGKPNLAEKAFREAIEHQYLDPIAVDYPLAWLGLGRALSGEGDAAGAKEAYQHFFTLWTHADANAVRLQQARSEFADLRQLLRSFSPQQTQTRGVIAGK
jgi:DNA-binding winged helix-turn-helix (wHTH) protein/tetratricopeptide (TPR) repeat protein